MFFPLKRLNVAVLAVMSGLTHAQLTYAEEPATIEIGAIEVTSDVPANEETKGTYLAPVTSGSTGLQLTQKETPQAMTVVTQQQMQDFNLDTLDKVLDYTPGVTVERVETDRMYYTARGFDITNFQLDGMAVPAVYGNDQGGQDTVIYDRVEVLKGANGLMSASGQPSATVNFVRKRPTKDLTASSSLSAGSWGTYRVEGDVSGSLNADGSIRGRLVGALEDAGSYLDRYEKQTGVFYGVIEADLSDTTLLTIGHDRQIKNADSPLWGALPMQYSDGSPTDYDVSTSTSADWAYWDKTTTNTFAELTQQLDGGWDAQIRATYSETESESELFYVYGTPDVSTGLGLAAYPSRYDLETEQFIIDAKLTGPFQLAGREHELVLGTQWFRSKIWDESNYGQGIGTPLTATGAFDGSYPRPTFDASVSGSEWTHYQRSVYGAANFNVTDRLSVLTGLRVTSLDSEGVSYGSSRNSKYDHELIPYAGLVFDVTHDVSLYASYTEIFDPQEELDANLDVLDPVEGKTYEIGIKADLFGGAALGSVAVFRTEQENVAEAVGMVGTTTIYDGVDGVTSNGFEVDIAGEVLPGLDLQGGYTYVDIKSAEGVGVKEEIPMHMFKVVGTYQLASIPELTLGTGVRWQDEVKNTVVTQGSYTVVDLLAKYEFTPRLKATLNVNNVTDEKYLNSIKWDQAYYAAPRNAVVGISWDY